MSVKCLIYCTKAKPRLFKTLKNNIFYHSQSHFDFLSDFEKENILNGKIVASFDCEKVDYYEMEYHKNNLVMNDISIYDEFESKEWGHDCFKRVISNEYSKEEIANCELIKKSCLSFDELGKYVCSKNEIDNFYAIHISNLEIFDKPKELSEYSKRLPNGDFQQLGKAPQNMMNVCKIKYLIEDYVLISIKPEWVANILNGEKTIEVRKQVVNKLKELILNE